MKIKEVIEKTGLTDRAIRLYISNGLIEPASQRSYTGRNSYEFTEEDVAQLKRIALLRKADFSLEQIRILREGGEPVRQMLAEFVAEKKEQLERNQKILAVLQTLEAGNIPTLETLCELIHEGFEPELVPKEDLKPTKKERLEAWTFRLVAILVLTILGLVLTAMIIVWKNEFLFPKPGKTFFNYIGIANIIIPLILMTVVILLYRKTTYNGKKKHRRRSVAITLVILTALIVFEPIGKVMLLAIPPVYSETDDPCHYLQLGYYEREYGSAINELFPQTIPRSAVAEDSSWYPPDKFPDTTKYYYYHALEMDPNFDLYAEWVLPEDEYLQEVERFEVGRSEKIMYREQRGDWTCLHFTDHKADIAGTYAYYRFVIFAYNDEENAVRYIMSYAQEPKGVVDPYFLSLEWQ